MPYANPTQQREYQVRWLRKRREEWLKAHGPCVACRSTVDLEVDHVDPNLKLDHNVWSWSECRRAEELAKCQILCKRCHMKKTLEQRPSTQHGCAQMYQKYKCRCDVCRSWKQASDARYRSVRKSKFGR